MKSIDSIKNSIASNKELIKRINNESFVSIDDFVNNSLRYIKAVKECRIMCSIGGVSSSGMSRSVKFTEMNESAKDGYRVYNFYLLFKMLGYKEVNNSDYFRINGCGMDMIFHTNYSIIYDLYTLGFISKKQCETLSQKKPHII